MIKTNINGILTLNSKPLGFIEIVKGFGAPYRRSAKFGAKKFSANISVEYFTEKVFNRFLVLKPHFESGPAWGLGLTGWGLWPGENICAEYFRRSVFAETFSASFSFWNHILNLGLPGGWGLWPGGWG